MGENQKKILQMLAEGKINVEEASQLLSLIGSDKGGESQDTIKLTQTSAKYLYVKVDPKPGRETHENAKVNVRVPVSLIRAGMKLTALIPPQVAEDINRDLKGKGFGFDIRNLKDEYVEQLVDALRDTEIMVDSVDAEIKVYAQ
jgi:hypothetical protein